MRKIVIDDIVYLWSFKSKRDYVCHSSLVIRSEDRAIKLVIKFKTTDDFTAGSPLNEGLPMQKDGAIHIINLNKPSYIAEIFKFIRKKYNLTVNIKTEMHCNGNDILAELGYVDTHRFLLAI